MKRKLSKIIAVLLSFLMLFSGMLPAYALSEGDKASFTENHTGVHYNIPQWTMNGHTHSAYGEITLRNLSDGTPLYCLEPYHDTQGTSGTATNIRNTPAWYNLDSIAQDGITRVSIYGYPSFRFDDSQMNETAQFVTHILIWEFVSDTRNGYTGGPSSWASSAINQFDRPSQARSYYDRILALCNDHTSYPAFSPSGTVTLKGIGTSNAVVLKVTNGVDLDSFKTQRSNENISYNVNDNNTVSVWAVKSGSNLSSSITFTKRNTDIGSALAITGANQTMLYGSIADPIRQTVNFKIESTATLKVHKSSEDGNIKGLKFVLGASAYRQEAVTDETGTATFTNIPVNGNQYYLSEEFTQEQAVYLATFAKREIDITQSGKTYTYEAENTLKRGRAEFTKTDETTGEAILAGDGIFKVQQWSEKKNCYVDYAQMTYDSDTGKYISPELVCTSDNMAKFRVIEIKAPSGYDCDDTPYDFTIGANGETVLINNGKITNIPSTGTLVFSKVGEVFTGFEEKEVTFGKDQPDEDASQDIIQNSTDDEQDKDEVYTAYKAVYEEKNIPGASYELRAAEDILQNGTVLYKSGDVITEIITDYTPTTVTELPVGKFELQEKTAPAGYLIDPTVYPFEITNDSYNAQVDIQTVTVLDTRQKILIDLQKTMQMPAINADENAYKNVIFAIYAGEDITNYENKVVLEADTIIDYITISENGGAICPADLPTGFDYYIKEIKTDEKYILDDNIYEFSTVLDNNNQPLNTIYINNREPIINSYITGFVEFKKVDSENESTELEAVYGLYTKGGTLIDQKKSRPGEWTRFEALPVGEYYLQEILPPGGYYSNSTKYEFEITPNSNGRTIQITAKDTKIPETPIQEKSPETGTENGLILICAIIAAAGGTCAAVHIGVRIRKKRIKK